MASEDELIEARRKHVAALEEAGSRAFPAGFEGDDDLRREVVEISADEQRCAGLPGEADLPEDAKHYPLYGRVMAKRGPFLVIQTPHGSAQALVRPDDLSEAEAALFKTLDLADHVAVTGPLLRTRTGALTVKAVTYEHIGKALLPPPAKWHGLTDVEKRYRERYVDLFANREVAGVFRKRARILTALREYLDSRDFLEVETPILQSLLGGATARPFRTHHNALDIPLYMRVAPELYLKRLLVGGFDRVYELGRTFRNEGVSTRHNPEFTILEAYSAYWTMDHMLEFTEGLIRHVHSAVGSPADSDVDLEAPWRTVTMREAIVERCVRAGEEHLPATPWTQALGGKDAKAVVHDEARLNSAFERVVASWTEEARRRNPQVSTAANYGARIFALFEEVAEEELAYLFRNPSGTASVPVFVTEHPVEVSPLARRNDADPRFVDRFELFVRGSEVANAFSELNDPDDQAARFEAQLENRAKGDEEAMDFDADYIRALQHGMPPAAGLGVGVDRLVMLLCNQHSIRDVLLFPLLKPESG